MSVLTVLETIAETYSVNPKVNNFIALAELQTNRCWFGTKADYAVALRTAHMMSMTTSSLRNNGEAGAVSSKKEGDLSITFNTGTDTSDLSQSHFGKTLMELQKQGGAFTGVTGGNDRFSC